MTINYIIVEVDDAYKNEIDGLVVNSTIESVAHINRVAKVVEAPSFTIIEKGDEVVVHHNMFRLRNGLRGKRVSSNYHLEGNRYFIPLTEVFMYRRGGEWQAIRPFVFVEPIKQEDEVIGRVIINSDNAKSHNGMVKLQGIIKYPNDELTRRGVSVGDKVVFSYWSEYEFNIDGETLYKMSTNDILAVI